MGRVCYVVYVYWFFCGVVCGVGVDGGEWGRLGMVVGCVVVNRVVNCCEICGDC